MHPRRLAAALGLALSGLAQAADYASLPGGRFDSALPQGDAPDAVVTVGVAPFALRRTPVTVAEYARFVETHPEWRRGAVPALLADARYLVGWRGPLEPPPGAAARPVVDVSWFAARAFCESEGARLPTWLEWEYAAAADETRTDARADPAWRRRILGWYERPGSAALPDVGGPPDVHGVSDLHGVVWEWVEDFNALFISGDSRTQGDPDRARFCGAGAIGLLDRENYAVLMRVAFLSSLGAADTAGTLGFRCARAQPGVSP